MPGSPYLDERPKGLLTWPVLIGRVAPFTLIGVGLSVWADVLFEVLVVMTGALFLTAWLRR